MRSVLRLVMSYAVSLCAAAFAVQAGPREDCEKWSNAELAISACSEIIQHNPKDAAAHNGRGNAYLHKGDFDRALTDYSEAIKVDPRLAASYTGRGNVYYAKGDYDRALADYSESISRDGVFAFAHYGRGNVYWAKGDHDRALAEYKKVHPLNSYGYVGQGEVHLSKGEYDGAIEKFGSAIHLDRRHAAAYSGRGRAYRKKLDYVNALADLDEGIRLAPSAVQPYVHRGEVYEAKGQRDLAIEDYTTALSLPARSKQQIDRQGEARKRLAELQRTSPAAVPMPAAPQPTTASLGRRVALVIGFANYRTVPKLANPLNDARAVAAALRAASFTEVIEQYDLGVLEMQRAVSAFEDKATDADWAVIYYAGHGIEVDGRNYLIPVDAQLKRASDVEDEALALDRVMARVAVARKLQLVILDACRENPFASRMVRAGGTTRSVGMRGLAAIEPTYPNLIVAYAARDGQVALDGQGANSPYAKALAKYLAEPGLELGIFFRRVRADVLTETSGKQRPFEYGSLTDENLYFRPLVR